MPSETRSTQARLFNDPNSGFDILVASDAIGMGLNLNIGRIIFHTTVKRGDINKPISYIDPSNIKQIAGRAGRRSSNYPIGLVTSWQDCDLAYIRAVMDWDIEQISSVGIFPSIEQIEIFSKQLQKVSDASATSLEQIDENNSITDNSDMNAITRKANNGVDVVEIQQPNVQLSQIMEKFVKLSKIDNKYFLCNHDSLIIVSNWLHSIPLSLTDR